MTNLTLHRCRIERRYPRPILGTRHNDRGVANIEAVRSSVQIIV